MNVAMAMLFWIVAGVCPLLSVYGAPMQASPQKLNEKGLFLKADTSMEKAEEQKPKFGKSKERSSQAWNPFAPEAHHPSTRLTCGITERVGAHTDKYEDCPADCPYFAQNRKDTEQCTFLCVPGEECGTWNPNKPIPDSIKNSKTCRGPKVAFCTEPKLDGSDSCQQCQSGFALHTDDGQCYFEHWTIIIIITSILVAGLTIVTVWVVDLCCREHINDESVAKGEQWRSRSKVLMPRVEGQTRHTWPIHTNLCRINVAGTGMMLHFNFQAFFIVWPIFVALVWTVLACFHEELFILGTRKFGTPRHNCILVAWGYETQQRLMWTKVLFLAIVYVVSFFTFLLFSVRQHRIYQQMDALEKTMKDFAVELKGLPELPGNSADVEKDIQKAVEDATGKKLVGVSVAWNYTEQQEAIDIAVAKEQFEREIAMGLTTRPTTGEDPTENMNAMHKYMYNKEKDILGPDEDENVDVKALIEQLVSSESAYLVFSTEEDKDEVLKSGTEIKFDATKYGFGEQMLYVEEVINEPANINWHNFGDSDPNAMVFRFFKGFFKVYVPALLIWFFGFYVPYAASLYYFNYDNGAELPGYYSIIFTIVVCGGNATMYVVCDVCCDIIGFRYKDTKQMTYMLMYLAACMINVFLDMVVTYYTALKIMVGLDFRTYHGKRLADIDTFTEQFETYAMQRSLGENTYRYAWPSTFFLCFVLEPFVTILIPYLIGKKIIATHKEIQGTCAEAYIMAFEFDLGRYADILLNVFLGILIFFFPGGYIWTLFYAMAFSHTFIYCFDHWRVLNVIPSVKIVSSTVDWWAQVMMCGCCATILSCLVFKANCETYTNYCLQDVPLVASCSLAFVVHFIVHLLLLIYLVPTLGKEYEDENEGMKFEAIAKGEARTWFSVNPVHCLRSQLIHGDKPHCRYISWGKEHLLEVNEKIGCYFFDEAAETEDFSPDLRKSLTSMSQGLGNMKKSMTGA
jgi:hypothetical protein